MVAKIMAAIVAGAWLFQMFSKKKEISLDWKTALVGSLLISALSLVPIIGWLLCFLAYLLALGGAAGMISDKWKAGKK
jgi:hypothetical protein